MVPTPADLIRLIRGKTIKRIAVKVPDGTPGHGLAIVTIVRNEAACLAEWLSFHIAQGVTHVFVYDNESTDGTAQVLEPYREQGLVTVIPWVHRAGYHTQARAYAHALSTFGGGARWMAFIDVDEFLFCPDGLPLRERLKGFEHRPALIVHRHTFGTSGHAEPPHSVTRGFVWRVPAPEGPFEMIGTMAPKSIVQPRHVTAVNGAHTFRLRGTKAIGYDENDDPLNGRKAPAFRDRTIRINHYYTKDRQSFQRRISRGKTASNIHVPEERWFGLLQDVESRANVRDESIAAVLPASAS